MERRDKYIFFSIVLFLILSGNCRSQTEMYKVERVPVSSGAFNEIAPVIFKDGIMFCSDRRTSSIKTVTTFKDERLFNIYVATKKDTSRWGSAIEMKAKGSQLLYYGPMSVSSDNKTVYFTSSIFSGASVKKKGVDNFLGIFIGDLSGNEITNIRPFPANNPVYNVFHPSISRDGRYLFFACDMPGGQGGSDIYYCEFLNGKWGSPVNLGKKVNSVQNEIFPNMHPSGRLFFTSNRPSTADFMGKMDVYYTSLVYGEWDNPIPMPQPINSKYDDFAFVASENFQEGYFSRNTGGTDDIFSYKSTMVRKSQCDTIQKNSYCYGFLEENAIKYDTMKVPFRYIWNFGDGTSAEGVYVEHCYKTPGKYKYRLDVENQITKKVESNIKNEEIEVSDIVQAYISSPDTWSAGQQLKLSADSTNLPGWTISEYYWNFGDMSVEIGKNVVHSFSRTGTYNVQLMVKSAPDANGKIQETCVFKNIRIQR